MIFAAFSIHSFVDKVGAYVGFAAAIGLALFALLLFAQARELKRLREWGAQAHDRIGELERRLAAALELARRASSSQRTMAPQTAAPRPAGAPRPGAPAVRPVGASTAPGPRGPVPARTSSPTRLPLLPAAPARVAGAALGSATVLVPLPKHPPGAAPAASPVTSAPVAAPATPAPNAPPVAPPTATAVPAGAAATSAGAAPAPATVAAQAPARPAVAPPSPPPTVASPSATNGHSDTFPPVSRPAPARPTGGARPPARGGARPGPARPAARQPAAAPLRARSTPSATVRTAPTAGGDASRGGRRRLLLVGLVLVAIAAVAVIALASKGSNTPSQTAAATGGTPAGQTTRPTRSTPAAAPAHNRITVAVLNGTTTAGLASRVAATLTGNGFRQGPVTNASDQQRSVTVVSYFGGHEAEAREVAKTLNVPSDAVQPIDPDTEAACAQGGACTVPVVVTVGADLQ